MRQPPFTRTLEEAILGLTGNPERRNSFRSHVLAGSVLLLTGVSVFAGVNTLLAAPRMAAVLALCSILLPGILLVMLRLRSAAFQRKQTFPLTGASELNILALIDSHDKRLTYLVVQRFQALQKEIDELHAREKLLEAQAYHDGLTGLANRLLLGDRFDAAVERAKRTGKSVALLMIDLNDFKAVNDLYGHAAGDAVLIATARRLKGAVRASDTVARFGGDEFVVIIESIEQPQEIVHVGEKLFDALAEPIMLDTGVLERINASLGLAMYPADGSSLNELLSVADQAMYECKSTGLMALE